MADSLGANGQLTGVEHKMLLIHGMQPIKWPIHGVKLLVANSWSASGRLIECSL